MQCTSKRSSIIAFFKSNLINYKVKSSTPLTGSYTAWEEALLTLTVLFFLLQKNTFTISSEDTQSVQLRTEYDFCSDHQASVYHVTYHQHNISILRWKLSLNGIKINFNMYISSHQ